MSLQTRRRVRYAMAAVVSGNMEIIFPSSNPGNSFCDVLLSLVRLMYCSSVLYLIERLTNSYRGRRACGDLSIIWFTWEAVPHKSGKTFHSWSFPPCLRGVKVKVLLGKEDTAPFSMEDCHVKQTGLLTSHRTWNKATVSRVTKGNVRVEVEMIRVWVCLYSVCTRTLTWVSTNKKIPIPYNESPRRFRLYLWLLPTCLFAHIFAFPFSINLEVDHNQLFHTTSCPEHVNALAHALIPGFPEKNLFFGHLKEPFPSSFPVPLTFLEPKMVACPRMTQYDLYHQLCGVSHTPIRTSPGAPWSQLPASWPLDIQHSTLPSYLLIQFQKVRPQSTHRNKQS